MRRGTHQKVRSFDYGPKTETRTCDYPACPCAGEYRAPKSRDNLRDYFWFCLDHVRAYNASWDYFEGMSEDEVELHIRKATIWDRPSWRPGAATWYQAHKDVQDTLWREFGIGPNPNESAGSQWQNFADKNPSDPSRGVPELEALGVLGLDPPVQFDEIKDRYRDLAKRYHPDINGGCKDAEERLKEINVAFHILKQAYGYWTESRNTRD